MILLRGLVVSVLCLLLSACIGVPVESLRAYGEAFQQAKNAGDLLLDEISPIVSNASTSQDGKKCGRSPLGYPTCFDPRAAVGGDALRANEDVSIRARRDALAAVALYNDLLVQLAEGKSAEAIQARIDELAGLASAVASIGIIPSGGLSALVTPGAAYANDLVRRLEGARASAAVRQAILDSRPDIQELLSALADDTPKMYAVFLRARERDLVAINHDRNLARLSGDKAAQSRAAKRYDAAVESISKFHESLAAYVQLLDKTSDALDTLANAAGRSPGTVASLTAIAREAAEVEASSTAFWNKIREVRASAAASQP